MGWVAFTGAFFLLACSSSDPVDGEGGSVKAPENGGTLAGIPRYTYEIVNTYPHDPAAFTQGLVYADGYLFESTGRHGSSSLRKVELTTGRVQQQRNLADEFFAEGLELVGDCLFQLTFREQVGFVYDRESFELLRKLSYPTEGWGLTHDGKQFVMSDGTPNLYFRNNDSFDELGRVQVTHEDSPLNDLNELEFVQGEVFANIWQTDLVARIDPATGQVLGWIDLRGLLSVDERAKADVLNGIAYDAVNERLFVTGKLWPWLFEIRLKEISNR